MRVSGMDYCCLRKRKKQQGNRCKRGVEKGFLHLFYLHTYELCICVNISYNYVVDVCTCVCVHARVLGGDAVAELGCGW